MSSRYAILACVVLVVAGCMPPPAARQTPEERAATHAQWQAQVREEQQRIEADLVSELAESLTLSGDAQADQRRRSERLDRLRRIVGWPDRAQRYAWTMRFGEVTQGLSSVGVHGESVMTPEVRYLLTVTPPNRTALLRGGMSPDGVDSVVASHRRLMDQIAAAKPGDSVSVTFTLSPDVAIRSQGGQVVIDGELADLTPATASTAD